MDATWNFSQDSRPDVLQLEGVSKKFGDREVLSPISYTIPDLPGRGEFVVLVGPSGCGKSTLLNLISGLQKPTTGKVKVFGKEITGPGKDRAVVFQSHNDLPWRTVVENVEFGMEISGEPREKSRQEALAWLDKVGLKGHHDKYPKNLSGGQRQRLGLARVLVNNPRIILLDEPFSALDVKTREDMQDLYLKVWQEVEGTAILVSHDLTEAVYMADQILVMSPNPGKIHKMIPISFREPRTRALFRDAAFKRYVDSLSEEIRSLY